MVKESLYSRLGYINSAERGKILSYKDKMRSSLLAFFVCISVASSLFFKVSFKNLLNTIGNGIKTLVPFFLKEYFQIMYLHHLLFFELQSSNFWLLTYFFKLLYSEKATKFCEISTLLLSYVVSVKVRWRFPKILWPSHNIWTLIFFNSSKFKQDWPNLKLDILGTYITKPKNIKWKSLYGNFI